MRWISLILLLAAIVSAGDSLVKDGGFEDASLKSWLIFTHDQDDFVSIGQDAVDYMEGQNSMKVSIGQKPRVYVGFAQHVALPEQTTVRRILFQARIPAKQKINVLLEYGKGIKWQMETVEGIGDWKKYTVIPDMPPTAEYCHIEFRFTESGEYHIDDVSLDADLLNPTGEANRYLFINGDGPTVSITNSIISPALRESLAINGDEQFDGCLWEDFSQDRLTYVKCVFFRPMLKMSAQGEDLKKIEMLAQYVQDGGSLVIFNRGDQMYSMVIYPILLMERFGAKINLQYVDFPEECRRKLGNEGGDNYAYVSDIRGECAKGVGQMLVPAGTSSAFIGCIPFQGDENWKNVLYAGKGSSARPIFEQWGLEIYQRNSGEGADYSNGIPIGGFRDYGKGRVGYLGMFSDCYSVGSKGSSVDTAIMEKIYRTGNEGPVSNFGLFMRNYVKMMTYNSVELKGKTYPRTKTTSSDKYDSRQYRGVIGARTSYSTGESTPGEYVDAARRAGLDFIVFLEDFENLPYEKFEALRKECIALSDDSFCAMAGFTYRNIDGNYQYIYSNEPMYPGASLLTEDGRRFKTLFKESEDYYSGNDLFYLYTMLSFQCNSGWYNFSKSPYPYYDMRSVCCMGLVTQEGGKTIDFSKDALAGTNRDEQYIWPQALTLMKNASEMELVSNGTYFHNEIGADSFSQMVNYLGSHASRSSKSKFPGIPCFGRTAVTQGPELLLDMPRGDMNPEGNPYSTVLNHWPLKLEAKAEADIAKIEILDGMDAIRVFKPNSRTFSYSTNLPNNIQHHIWARMETVDGRIAYTRSISSDSWLMRDIYCMDRNNPLFYSLQYYKDGRKCLVTNAADSVTPWKGPWNGWVRPVGSFVEDEVLGTGKLRYDGSPGYHPQLFMLPGIYDADGRLPAVFPYQSWQGPLVAGVEGGVHNHPERLLFSSDVHIADFVMDGVFAPDACPIIMTHFSLFPIRKSEYLETTARKTMYRLRPGGMSTYVWEQDFTVLKDLPVCSKGICVKIGAISPNGGDTKTGVIGGKRQELTGHDSLNAGDFISYAGNSYGTLVVFVLSDGIKMDGDTLAFAADGLVVPAGTKYHARLLFVGMNRLVENPVDAAMKFADDFGLSGKVGYTVNAVQGQVTGNDFELKVKGDFAGTVSGLSAMDSNLPVMVSGVCDNISAIVKCSEGIRLIGQKDGVAYALLTEREDGKELFIGNPVLTDDPDVIVTLSMDNDYKTWRMEFHNPTTRKISTRIKANAASGLTLDREIVLEPGASEWIEAWKQN